MWTYWIPENFNYLSRIGFEKIKVPQNVSYGQTDISNNRVASLLKKIYLIVVLPHNRYKPSLDLWKALLFKIIIPDQQLAITLDIDTTDRQIVISAIYRTN